MINPISTSGTPGTTPKPEADSLKVKTAVKTEQSQVKPPEVPIKLETPIKTACNSPPLLKPGLCGRRGKAFRKSR